MKMTNYQVTRNHAAHNFIGINVNGIEYSVIWNSQTVSIWKGRLSHSGCDSLNPDHTIPADGFWKVNIAYDGRPSGRIFKGVQFLADSLAEILSINQRIQKR